jgi:hypothetical protein
MELDEFKSAWKSLDARLARDNALSLQLLRDRRTDKARSSLRPLFWGQLAQMAFGLVFIVLGGLLWSTRPDVASVIVAGVVVHLYGLACAVLAGATLAGIGKIDYAAPVLEIQKALARVRKLYIVGGIVAGLPWWFLWVPLLIVLSALIGVDLVARAPGMVWIGLAVGAIGLLGTWWFHRWSRSPARPRLAEAMEDAVTGRSLRRAQAQLEELQRFEQG